MIILQPIATAQLISVYLRNTADTYTARITEEETQVETLSTVTGTYDSGVFTFNISHDFLNNRFYYLEILDGDTDRTLNKSKIFTTTQTDLEGYTINNSYYQTIDKDERTFTVKQ